MIYLIMKKRFSKITLKYIYHSYIYIYIFIIFYNIMINEDTDGNCQT